VKDRGQKTFFRQGLPPSGRKKKEEKGPRPARQVIRRAKGHKFRRKKKGRRGGRRGWKRPRDIQRKPTTLKKTQEIDAKKKLERPSNPGNRSFHNLSAYDVLRGESEGGKKETYTVKK